MQAAAGFRVKEPTYLPPGYRVVAPLALATDGGNARVSWWAMPVQPQACETGLGLIQERVPPEIGLAAQAPLGRASAAPVTVQGTAGLWVEGGAPPGCDAGALLTGQAGSGNFLLWDLDGIRYTLAVSSNLSLEEALKVAESLPR